MKTIPFFAVFLAAAALLAEDLPRYRWENFTAADGLPNNRVYAVCVDGERVWAGTDDGLALFEHGKWRVFRPADGQADARSLDRDHGRPEPLFRGPFRHVYATD